MNILDSSLNVYKLGKALFQTNFLLKVSLKDLQFHIILVSVD